MSERTTDAYEAARDAVAALMNANDRARDRLHPQRHRVAQPDGAQLWPWHAEAGPGGADLGHGAPFQHRALAVAAGRARDRVACRAGHRYRRTRHGRRSRRCLPTARSGWSSITHMSNVLGTVTPAERIVRMAHAHGAKVLFDGAQAVVHRARRCAGAGLRLLCLDRAQAIWPDRHRRAVGPARVAGAMPPFLGGGEMISSVTYERSTWAEVPHKFEAGTPPILEGIGLKAAIDYVQRDRLRRDRGARGVAGRSRTGAAVGGRRRAHPGPGAGSWRRGVVRARPGARA